MDASSNAAMQTENQKSSWTHVNVFHNVSDAVTSKTHKYFGWVVAAITCAVTIIPTLIYDMGVGVKSLYERKVSKTEAPVQNQVSTKGAQTAEAKKQPTVEQLRKDNPELDNVMKAMEASADEIQQKANGHEAEEQQQALLANKEKELANMSALYQEERVKGKKNCDMWAAHYAKGTDALKNELAVKTQGEQNKTQRIQSLKFEIAELEHKYKEMEENMRQKIDILDRELYNKDQETKKVKEQSDFQKRTFNLRIDGLGTDLKRSKEHVAKLNAEVARLEKKLGVIINVGGDEPMNLESDVDDANSDLPEPPLSFSDDETNTSPA